MRRTAPPATVWHAVAHPEMDPDVQHLEQLARWQRGETGVAYFRIFNPLTQQQKFDRDGAYVSRWVPEVSTPAYPGPMVDVQASRKVALAAYDDIAAHH
ncbi:FAD-binding domain-containing protein [Corynebacterium godavarianum]|uniref:FAD-binding domain-containing protein n=1 Tax=Corynebacterium godavarianum TaxID=2054421 RepID=UPI001EE43153|nr:FAD-binding domain-containing protein [Corynebacterium godavarianum]